MQTFFIWKEQLTPHISLSSSSTLKRERERRQCVRKEKLQKLDAFIIAAALMAISGSESKLPPLKVVVPSTEAEVVKCESCGFTEECTPEYISRVRENYHGRWICGLCVEAVKDEVMRSERHITTEEALNRHISFCNDFRSSSPPNGTEHPISAIGRLLRRRLDSPRSLPSTSCSEVDVPPERCIIG